MSVSDCKTSKRWQLLISVQHCQNIDIVWAQPESASQHCIFSQSWFDTWSLRFNVLLAIAFAPFSSCCLQCQTCNLCWVAGNTAWSHMACEFP